MSKRISTLMLVFCFVACVCLLSMDAGQAGAAGRYFIKFATVAPEGSTWIKHMRTLDKDLRKRTGGRLGFRIYAGGIAGDELDVLKKIRIGQIHCAAFSGVGFGQILPMVRVLDLPFLFRSYDEIDRVHEKLRPFFAERFRKRGFELLGWAEVGNVHLFSIHSIRRVRDLSGLKIWTWSGDPISKETFVAMGTNPIPLAVTDVTTALNTGMIDTVYAPPLGALALQWYASLKYMMALPLANSTGAILLSSKYFNRLPQDLKKVLASSLDDAMKKLTAALRKQTREAVSLIQQSGIIVVPRPKGGDLEEFYRVHDRVARKLTGRVFPATVLKQVYEILKR